ncbi:MAG: hypothetical protein NTY33_01185 [Candidatus Moranbacteria bacterium]|nr:hypothetical protein [Candidatus Moranbacteria bacterium]
MQKILKTSVVLLGIIFLAGCGQSQVVQTQPTPAPVVEQPAPEAQVDKKAEWKTFSFNGTAFSFEYPAKICQDSAACHDLFVTKNGETVSIGQMQEGESVNGSYIDPILSIYYVASSDQISAEKYVKDKYKNLALPNKISWTVDKENPEVSVANLESFRVYAAYSKGLKTLVTFSLQPACIFDCQVDGEMLNSIKLDGVSVYQSLLTKPIDSAATATQVYKNAKYGFELTFPATWQDYNATNRTLDWGSDGQSDSIDFGLPAQPDGLFNISFHTKKQWEAIKSEGGPVPELLGENGTYVFVWAQAQYAKDSDIEARMKEVQGIIKTFKLTK